MRLGIGRLEVGGAFLALALVAMAHGQSTEDQQALHPSEGAQEPAEAGVRSVVPHVAVYDAEHRPITAGGFVKDGPTIFQDISESSGLAQWHNTTGTPEKTFILETVGAGVGLVDYDNDGWLDIYLVNGATYDSLSGKTTPPHAALFHNNHDGTFTDVTEKAGVANDRWGEGVAIADYDNDGWPDIFVSNFGKNRLYRNNHDGTFTDIAEKAGVALGNWSTGATWGDFDGDGRLDLFVPGYVHYDVSNPPAPGSMVLKLGEVQEVLKQLQRQQSPIRAMNAKSQFCQFRGIQVMCGPGGLNGEPDHLFHNNGDGTFTDVSEATGTSDKKAYFGLTSLFIDVNNDGKVDLLVADDLTPNYLYLNNGKGGFDDVSFASGYALNESGRETASMGIAAGDLWHNGRVDLFNTTFSDDYKPLYRNDGDANFTDVSFEMGIAEPSVPFLGWGDAFIDYDNDGWLDLIEANGHIFPLADSMPWGTSFAQRPLLFHNNAGKLEIVAPVEGTGLARVGIGRGLAYGDLFNDGKIDVIINNMDGTPTLLRNVNKDTNHWVGLKLVGGPKSPRDAVGATVYLKANGFKQRADVTSGGSFASTSDPRLHFGLGQATAIDAVEVHWPDGTLEQVKLPGVDAMYTVVEGSGVGKPIATAKSGGAR